MKSRSFDIHICVNHRFHVKNRTFAVPRVVHENSPWKCAGSKFLLHRFPFLVEIQVNNAQQKPRRVLFLPTFANLKWSMYHVVRGSYWRFLLKIVRVNPTDCNILWWLLGRFKNCMYLGIPIRAICTAISCSILFVTPDSGLYCRHVNGVLCEFF